MITSAALAIGLFKAGLTIPELLLTTALMNAAVAVFIYSLVPEFLMRFITWVLVNTLYRVRVDGTQHIPEEGPVLLVCNHVSFMDPLLLMANLRRPARFVMYYKIFNIPLLNFVFRTAKAIPIAGQKEDPEVLRKAYEEVDAALADGEVVCIFPEGGLTKDGEVATFRPGVAHILQQRPVPVVPMALRGLWGSVWSRRDNMLRRARLPRRFRARVELVIGEPLAPAEAQLSVLEARVRELRGDKA
jgi:1-acyl-sn-glycerol-3-phosphate acyltransferase